MDHVIKWALENIDEANPDWTFVASRLYLQNLYEKAAANRGYDANKRYGDLYELIQLLTKKAFIRKGCCTHTRETISIILPASSNQRGIDCFIILGCLHWRHATWQQIIIKIHLSCRRSVG